MQESVRHEAGGKKVAGEKKPRPNGVWRMDAEGHGISHQDRIHTAGKPRKLRILEGKRASREKTNLRKGHFGGTGGGGGALWD